VRAEILYYVSAIIISPQCWQNYGTAFGEVYYLYLLVNYNKHHTELDNIISILNPKLRSFNPDVKVPPCAKESTHSRLDRSSSSCSSAGGWSRDSAGDCLEYQRLDLRHNLGHYGGLGGWPAGGNSA
jgi:hypothetical protein